MASTLFSNQSAAPSQQITNAPTATQTIKTILNNASPQTAFNTFLATNPQAQEAQQLIMQYGNGDPKKAFYELAKVRGIDPSRILSELGIG